MLTHVLFPVYTVTVIKKTDIRIHGITTHLSNHSPMGSFCSGIGIISFIPQSEIRNSQFLQYHHIVPVDHFIVVLMPQHGRYLRCLEPLDHFQIH
jgi:hypothetical protein